MPALETVGGGASEIFAPGNPIGLSLMGSGIGQLAGGAAGGSSGQALGGGLGGLAGGLGGLSMGMGGGSGLSSLFGGGGGATSADPIAAMSGGQFDLAGASGGNYLPSSMMDPSMAAAVSGGGGIPGMTSAGPTASGGLGGMLKNAMFGGGSSGGGMNFQQIMQQYPGTDPLQAMQMMYLQKMMNPDPMQQMMSAMQPIGQQLLQGRQQQQLAAMERQAPSPTLNGGAMPVAPSFGVGGAPVAAAPPSSMPGQYMQLLEMLTR